MTADSEKVTLIPNPYKAALAHALGNVRDPAATAASLLDPVVASMEGHAWVSPLAQEFTSGARDQDRTATCAGEDTVEAIRRAYYAQPDKVEPTAWQAHWRNLR